MATNSSSLLLNGTSNRAIIDELCTIRNLTEFTWMAWVVPEATSAYQRLYVERQGTGTGVRFAAVPYKGRLRFEFSAKDGRTDTNYDYTYTWDDRWHHIAFVTRGISGDDASYDMFLDGNRVAEGSLIVPDEVDGISDTAPMGGTIYLGNASFHTSGGALYATDRYWKGSVDEIILFSSAKPESDIIAYVGSNDTWDTADTEMIDYWRFDENTGVTSSSAKHGSRNATLTSSSMWQINRPFLGNGVVDSTSPTTPTLPATPTSAITDDGFTATWNSTTDNVYVQFYELQVSLFSDFSSYVAYDTGLTTTKAVTALLPNTNYYWRVRAFDAEINASNYSTTQSLTTLASGDLSAPIAPTNLTSSLVTHVSFRVSWTPSGSTDETGYKIDVAKDSSYTDYFLRNVDIGNVTQYDVVGTSPLTRYYVRLRAYDAADNEGNESASLVVQTAPLPDITPPLPIELLPATSIDSRAFTANWEEGIDDVQVSHYHIDLAYDDTFTSIVQIGPVVYEDFFLGNVTSYRFEGLSPEETYYYRVRATDGSGNTSSNVTPIAAQTTPSNVNEGGFITTIITPEIDSWTSSSLTGSNFGADVNLRVSGNGSANTENSFLLFDLTNFTGTLQSAMLRLYVTNASVDLVSIQAAAVTFDESTITWSNQPTVGGASITFVPSSIGEWVSVDISSLITEPDIYTIKLSMTGADVFTFSSQEDINSPELEVETDPTTATNVDEGLYFHDHTDDNVLTNSIKNPSGEDSTTNFWLGTGTFPAVISNVASATAYHGSRVFRAVCSGASSVQGARYDINDIPATKDDYWTADVSIRLISGNGALRLRILEYTAAGVFVNATIQTITATTEWTRFSVTRQLTGSTTERVSFAIETTGAIVSTFEWDAVNLHWGHHTTKESVYFDGDTSGAAWQGTVRASRSTLDSAQLHVESTFIGDSNEDNSVKAYFRVKGTTNWLSFENLTTTIDRTTKRASTLVGPSYMVANYLLNPSFEDGMNNWTLINPNANATLLTEIDNVDHGDSSARLSFGVGAGSGISANLVPAVAGELFYARARLFIPTGVTAKVVLRFYNSSQVFLSQSTPIVGEGEIIGDNEWLTLRSSGIVPVGASYVTVGIMVVSTLGGTIYVDAAMIDKNGNPYIDGGYSEGVWEGTANASRTGYILLPSRIYEFKHTYSDPDGVVNSVGETTYEVTGEHTTVAAPDNVTTTETILVEANPESLFVTVSYLGDDNDNNVISLQYKRSDLAAWTALNVVYNREAKIATTDIVGLAAGTSYTISASFSDSDGVFGINPLTQIAETTTDYGTAEHESTIMYNGFLLMGRSDGVIGVSEHDAFGFPERRVQVEDLPRTDGAIELSNLWGRRTISMTGFVSGDTRAELADNMNALKRALASGLGQLVIDTLADFGRYYYATVENLDIVEDGSSIRHLLWSADFVCADPFAYDTDLSILPEFSVANGGTSTLSNLGDLEVDTYIKIRTTHTRNTTVTVVNNTTGERITPSTTILKGDSLVIDTARKAVIKNGVEIDYIGSFPHLAVGSNQFTYTLSATSGTPTVLVTLNWRAKYI